jgi:hypothetical protein
VCGQLVDIRGREVIVALGIGETVTPLCKHLAGPRRVIIEKKTINGDGATTFTPSSATAPLVPVLHHATYRRPGGGYFLNPGANTVTETTTGWNTTHLRRCDRPCTEH